ncbi:hypothetical protein HDV00_000117 [Rhizophlyctis rosea]|nr:hypothetical protein HDV00_000117 [Rhizophlyctis rosea]
MWSIDGRKIESAHLITDPSDDNDSESPIVLGSWYRGIDPWHWLNRGLKRFGVKYIVGTFGHTVHTISTAPSLPDVLVGSKSSVVLYKWRSGAYGQEDEPVVQQIEWDEAGPYFISSLLTPDAKYILIADQEQLRVHSAETGGIVEEVVKSAAQKLIKTNSELTRVAILERGSSNGSPSIVIRNLLTGTDEIAFENSVEPTDLDLGGPQKAASCAVSSDGTRLISGHLQQLVIWDLSAKTTQTLLGHPGTIRVMAISVNGHFLTTACTKKVVKAWNLQTLTNLCTFEMTTPAPLSLAIDDTGTNVIVGPQIGHAQIWDISSCSLIYTLDPRNPLETRDLYLPPYGISSIVISPDNKTICTTSTFFPVQEWNMQTGTHGKRRFMGPQAEGRMVATPDGKYFVTGGRKGAVKVYIAALGRCIRKLKGHRDQVVRVAVSRDGKRIVSASLDGTGRVWENSMLRIKREGILLEGGMKGGETFSFSTDGRFVVAASREGTVRMWRSDDGRLVGSFSVTKDWTGVVVTGDGMRNEWEAMDDNTVREDFKEDPIREIPNEAVANPPR